VLPPGPPRAKPNRRRLVFLLLLLAVVTFVMWVTTSEGPAAQDIQELVGWKHDQTILDTPFTVGPHTFRYYKFALPEGSVNVAIVGQFAADASNGAPRKEMDTKGKGAKDPQDSGIEVYVLTDAAFTVWQNGYATSSIYESGKVPAGAVQAEIPAGAGIYYLVFSNKSSLKTPRSVRATVLLRYKSWLPEWFRRMKDRFWNWTGL
jgi:hypothetical protein